MKENEIRPKALFDEFLNLLEQDIETFFSGAPRRLIKCPACGASGVTAFEKHGFGYQECEQCDTLYASPRPNQNAFQNYYTDGKSPKFWATTFYRETEKARREKIWRPKSRQIRDLIEQYHADDATLIDIGGGYGLFIEEFRQISSQNTLVIEPNRHLADVCREKEIQVIEKFLEKIVPQDLPQNKKAFVSFELFEHLYDPGDFLDTLHQCMASGDLFIFSTLSGTGLDIQVLWEASNAVSPPQHLNFFNPHSVEILLNKCGFKLLEVTTPGRLDVDIICNNAADIKDRYWKNFVKTANEDEKKLLQELISTSGRSSHMLVVCIKE